MRRSGPVPLDYEILSIHLTFLSPGFSTAEHTSGPQPRVVLPPKQQITVSGDIFSLTFSTQGMEARPLDTHKAQASAPQRSLCPLVSAEVETSH